MASEPGPSAARTTWSLWPSGSIRPTEAGSSASSAAWSSAAWTLWPSGSIRSTESRSPTSSIAGPPRPTESSASAAPSLRVGLDELGRLLPFGGIQHAVSIGIKLIDDFPVLIASHHARRRSAGAPKAALWGWLGMGAERDQHTGYEEKRRSCLMG